MEEQRLILKHVGLINPVSATEYAAVGGYVGLKNAIAAPTTVISTIHASGLRGRGGAGFPVGHKWATVKDTPAERKYVICNAEESEPGTEKDRLILSGDPHAVIEGLAICGLAVGAGRGYICTHADYTQVCDTIEKALTDARKNGYLGKHILGSTFNFDIEIHTGTGSYICGEETTLLEIIEGHREEPRSKPPYPGMAGLWGLPTVINNVETLANIPVIMRIGVDAYKQYGTEKCPGTMLFTLAGDIVNPGVYEFQAGATMRQLFEEVGGGCPNGKQLQGVQVGGGACGAFVTPDMLDTPLDLESCSAAGFSLGTGSLKFFDEDTDVIELCHKSMMFLAQESCGKCTPCRLGNKEIADLIGEISAGRGRMADIETLEKLSQYVSKNSLCGLGQAVSTPVLSTLKNFRNDYIIACASSGDCAGMSK